MELLEQRLAELWEPKAEPVLAAKLFQRGRAELQRCDVHYFTSEGLARGNGGFAISSWDWLEAASQRLALRLTAVEDSATEEAKKRRREEGKSAAHELQKAKEETASLAGRLQEAEGDPNCFVLFGDRLGLLSGDLTEGFKDAINFIQWWF